MTPEEFREAGHQLIDWIADYRQSVSDRPVRAQVNPGDIASRFSAEPPDHTASFESLLATMERDVVPGITQTQSPMFFGWFPSNASLAAVLGDIACAGLGTLGITWESCPALTEVEEVVCEWMRKLVGLSDAWSGTIHDTASTASLVALLAARERASSFSFDRGGLQQETRPLVVYTSEEAHSSVTKAALLAGFGRDNLRIVPVDETDRAMNVTALRSLMREDRDADKLPAAVVASVGSTGVTAFDSVAEIVNVASEHGAWVHVDAAMAGNAMMLPEYRYLWEGVEGADSVNWNPHKWMGTLLDTSLFYVRDPQHLIRVMSTNPSYLRSTVDGNVTQYRDWGIPLGRRFRALKLWFHLQLDGVETIRARLRRDLDNAQWLAQQIESTPDWKVVAPVKLQTVCVRHEPSGLSRDHIDEHNRAWARAINESGNAFVTPAQIDDRWLVRLSVGAENCEMTHVEALWQLVDKTAQAELRRRR